MSNESCAIAVQEADGSSAVRVVVTGEVDASNCTSLHDVLARLADAGAPRHVEVDLGGLTFLDSSGLRALLVGQLALVERGGTLRIDPASEVVDRLLEITGLHEQLR